MRKSEDVIDVAEFQKMVHPRQPSRFVLALLFSVPFPLLLLAVIVTAGVVPLFVLLIIIGLVVFVVWFSARVVFAMFLGNSVLVSEVNYPRIQAIAARMKTIMDYPKPIYMFVYEHGSFNAYMRFLFTRRAIFLNSELLEAGVSDEELGWLIGRFIGYMRARQAAGVLGWLVRIAERTVVFALFILPYHRALVYTGDRLALAAIGGDISSTVSAMQKLLVGRQLGYSVNPAGIIYQQRLVKGSIFAFIARVTSAFPHATARYVDLVVFAEARYPSEYARFETANPGLPLDMARLAASTGKAQRRRPVLAWAAGGVTAAGLIVAYFLNTMGLVTLIALITSLGVWVLGYTLLAMEGGRINPLTLLAISLAAGLTAFFAEAVCLVFIYGVRVIPAVLEVNLGMRYFGWRPSWTVLLAGLAISAIVWLLHWLPSLQEQQLKLSRQSR